LANDGRRINSDAAMMKDQYHVQKALEVNDPKKKEENQITE